MVLWDNKNASARTAKIQIRKCECRCCGWKTSIRGNKKICTGYVDGLSLLYLHQKCFLDWFQILWAALHYAICQPLSETAYKPVTRKKQFKQCELLSALNVLAKTHRQGVGAKNVMSWWKLIDLGRKRGPRVFATQQRWPITISNANNRAWSRHYVIASGSGISGGPLGLPTTNWQRSRNGCVQVGAELWLLISFNFDWIFSFQLSLESGFNETEKKAVFEPYIVAKKVNKK